VCRRHIHVAKVFDDVGVRMRYRHTAARAGAHATFVVGTRSEYRVQDLTWTLRGDWRGTPRSDSSASQSRLLIKIDTIYQFPC
jgi:hypothetical protein